MGSRRLLGTFLSVLLSVSPACTTARMVPMQTQPGVTAPPGLRSGDRVRVHTHDGKHSDFDFDRVSAEGDVFGRNHEHVRASDIAMVERRSINKSRTSLLIAACAFGALAAAVIIGLAAGDDFLDAP
jgi:hypothetical protein